MFSFANENENLSKVSLFEKKGSKLPFSEFGSQSDTNSEHTNSTVFRIDTNQAHPMFCRVKTFSCWLIKDYLKGVKPKVAFSCQVMLISVEDISY